MEAPSDVIAADGVSQYSAEVIIFEPWTGPSAAEADDSLPVEVVRTGVEHLSESSVGCYTHGTMTCKIKNPTLWSAEKVSVCAFVWQALVLNAIDSSTDHDSQDSWSC